MRILLDEDSQAEPLAQQLRAAGHDVVTVNDLDMAGYADDQVFHAAQTDDRVVLTRNCADFIAIGRATPNHCGILLIYREGPEHKNMSYGEIVRAVHNLATSGAPIQGAAQPLNNWDW